MAAQYKTQCPHCSAQFNIGEDHLKQARGKVRCGSCLEVFVATRNLVGDNTGAGTNAGNQPAASSSAPSEKQQAARSQGSTPDQWSLPESEPAAPDNSAQPASSSTPANNTGVSLGDSELSDSFMSLEESDSDTDDFRDSAGADNTDESWAEQLLEELDEDDAGSTNDNPPTPSEPAPAPTNDAMSLFDEADSEPPEPTPREPAAPEPAQPDNRKPESQQDATSEAPDLFSLDLDGPDDEPAVINMDAPPGKHERRWTPPAFSSGVAQWLKWGALAVIALALLAAQYLIFNFQELSRTPEWRPLYATLCSGLGCDLPLRSNVEKIRGANLVVRDHPDRDDALVVDAMVFNEASYPQPFPQLELTFASMNDQPIAGRRFKPDEYRHGELNDLQTMPPGVPLHVSFSIKDPGERAVNYSLRFLPARESAN